MKYLLNQTEVEAFEHRDNFGEDTIALPRWVIQAVVAKELTLNDEGHTFLKGARVKDGDMIVKLPDESLAVFARALFDKLFSEKAETTFYERVHDEQTALRENIKRLEEFLATKAETLVSGEMQMLMERQADAMRLYEWALDERLELLTAGGH